MAAACTRKSIVRIVSALLLLLIALVTAPANAIQLRWSTGSADLTTWQDTQAMLIVQADSSEGALPNSWRLQWTADSLGLQFSPFELACLVDTAKVDSVAGPATPADSAANQVTAFFCSSGGRNATAAYYLVDLPAGGHGKLKVVALDPADPDSSTVISSNDVTYNGGVEGDYAPVVLSASSVHQSLQLSVSVVGANLSSASSLEISAPNGSWTLPLSITAQNDSAITGVALVAALLPACEASVGLASLSSNGAPIAADPDIQPELPESGGCFSAYTEELLLSPPSPLGYEVQPKDFSFTPGFVDPVTSRYALHLFYIRHNYWYYQPPNNQSQWQPDLDERNLGHAWTSDFVSWHGPAPGDKTDTTAIVARANKFDALHVWAPTIVHPPGPTFYMFYTGVGTDGGKQHQRIGVATSTDLNSWTQLDTPVLTAPQIPWVKKNPITYGGSQQLRDPYVMEYPIGSGHWIMYFVAVDSLLGSSEDMAVGAATSTDLFTWTALAAPFASTMRSTFQGPTHVVESAHVFKHNGQWWMPYTVGGNEVFFETSASADPTDTDPANWTNPVWLRDVTQGHPAEMQYWHASEHLGSGANEWIAAFNDNAIDIEFKGLYAPDPSYVGVDSLKLWCPTAPPLAGVGGQNSLPSRLRLAVSHPHLGSPDVGLQMELPWRTQVRLAIYDVAGRRRATLVDGDVSAGVTNIKWDGVDEAGLRVASGVYFVRLNCAQGTMVTKVIMLR